MAKEKKIKYFNLIKLKYSKKIHIINNYQKN